MMFQTMKFMVQGAVSSLLVTLLWLAPVAAAEYVATVDDGANLRSGPGTNYQVLYELPKGYPLQLIERQDKWLKVTDYENESGWIFATLVSNNAYAIVKVDEANVRSGPGSQYEKLGNVSRDVILKKLEKRGDWVKVSHPDLTGWINAKLIWP